MERRLAAILVADVVGYTRLVGEDEAGTIARLADCESRLIEPLVGRHGGRVVKRMGDGFLVEFRSAMEAVQCALAWQEGAKALEARRQGDALCFRIGINLGDVVVRGDDILGEGVNLASRLEALAEPGGLCVSEKVYGEVRGRLDVAYRDLGPQRVKNVAEPVRVYQVARTAAGGNEAVRCRPAPPAGARAGIAVLPFDNMSAEAEQDYFCDGIVEDLITELARLPWLLVIARHSSFAYRGRTRDVRAIGRELDVRYLVEGSIRRSSRRIRVTAQLIDVGDGSHLWAERYDRDLDDVFAVQDEVVGEIVAALAGRLKAGAPRPEPAVRPASLEAYECLLRGRQNVFSARGRALARRSLDRALEIEPELAEAHAWLAIYLYSDWVFYGGRETGETMSLALEAAGRAVALAPESSLSHMALGIVRLYAGDREPALRALRHALTLNPNDADLLVFLQEAYTFEGEPEKGIESVRRAIRLNPHHPDWYLWHLGFALYGARRYEQTVEALGSLREFREPLRILAAALARLGRQDEARAVAREFLTAFPDFSIAAWARSQPFKRPEDLALFIEGYRLAGLPE